MAIDKLFSQGGDVAPVLTDRVASGKEGKNAVNSSWSTIVAWLETVLGFLKITNNLSDLNNEATARTNLDVYSKGEANSLIGVKADKTNVLEKDNTTTYTPSSAYNPSTKKWVDEGGVKVAQAVATNVDSDVDSASFCNVSYSSAMLHVTGQIRLNGNPGVNSILFQIPPAFPAFATDWWFSACDSDGDENQELKAVAGTRNIVAASSDMSTGNLGGFGANIPAYV